MKNVANIKHPWQKGPTELIYHALEHLRGETEADKRIAYLLMDVGVETLLKTYLLLDSKVTGANGNFTRRKSAAQGNSSDKSKVEHLPTFSDISDIKFHHLVQGIETAAGSQLDGIDLHHIEFYHNIRNTLYHQGNGITVPMEIAQDYALLAVDMLNRLLKVDLIDVLTKPVKDAEQQKRLELHQRRAHEIVKDVKKESHRIKDLLQSVIEIVAPSLLLPSTKRNYERVLKEHQSFTGMWDGIEFWSVVEDDEEAALVEVRNFFDHVLDGLEIKERLSKKWTVERPLEYEGDETEILEVDFLTWPPGIAFSSYSRIVTNIIRHGGPENADEWTRALSGTEHFSYSSMKLVKMMKTKYLVDDDLENDLAELRARADLQLSIVDKVEKEMTEWINSQKPPQFSEK